MTYIDRLSQFWESQKSNPLSSKEALLYLFLLHQANAAGWGKPFQCKTKEIETCLCVTRATITTLRKRLQEKGLISFRKGCGSGSPVYIICECDASGEKPQAEVTFAKFSKRTIRRKPKRSQKPQGQMELIFEAETPPDIATSASTESVVIATPVELPPAQSVMSPAGISVLDSIELLRHSSIWLESTAMINQTTVSEIQSQLLTFANTCIAQGCEQHQSLSDVKRHFNAWYRKTRQLRKDADSRDAHRQELIEASQQMMADAIRRAQSGEADQPPSDFIPPF